MNREINLKGTSSKNKFKGIVRDKQTKWGRKKYFVKEKGWLIKGGGVKELVGEEWAGVKGEGGSE